jgi:hypothetical protein
MTSRANIYKRNKKKAIQLLADIFSSSDSDDSTDSNQSVDSNDFIRKVVQEDLTDNKITESSDSDSESESDCVNVFERALDLPGFLGEFS